MPPASQLQTPTRTPNIKHVPIDMMAAGGIIVVSLGFLVQYIFLSVEGDYN